MLKNTDFRGLHRVFMHALIALMFVFIPVNLFAACGGSQQHIADQYTHTITLNGNGASTQGTSMVYGGGIPGVYLSYCGTIGSYYNASGYLYSGIGVYTDVMTAQDNRIAVPTRSGYIFTGYYTSQSGGTQCITADGYITEAGTSLGSSSSTWYAQWILVGSDTVTIHYSCGGLSVGTGSANGSYTGGYNSNTAVSSVTYNSSYTLLTGGNVCAMSGYTFDHWDCENGPTTNSGSNWVYATSVDCVAQWRPSNGAVINLHFERTDFTNTPTSSVVAKTSGANQGVYRNLGYTNKMIPIGGSNGGANAVTIPSGNSNWIQGFTGYYTGINGSGIRVINSYGELLPDGETEALSYNSDQTWYASYLNPKSAIKLDSTGAKPNYRGTEFLAVDCGNGGCYSNNATQVPYNSGVMTTHSNGCANPISVPQGLDLGNNAMDFAGYYSQSQGGTQYIDKYGCITSAGLSHVSTTHFGASMDVWYAHWVPKGTDPECGDGYSSGNIFDGLDIGNTAMGKVSYAGISLKGSNFESKEPEPSKNLTDLRTNTPFGEGTYGFDFNTSTIKYIIGTSGCFLNEGDNYNETWPSAKENDWLMEDAAVKPDGTNCWCKTTGYSVDGTHIIPVTSSSWLYANKYVDQGECEDSCAEYCVNTQIKSREFFTNITSFTEACVPDEYTVNYYCDEDDFLSTPNNPSFSDTVYYDQVGYTLKSWSACGRNGYHDNGTTCLKSNYTALNVNDINPWAVGDDVYCYTTWTPNNYTITLNKRSGSGGSSGVYTVYNTGVYTDVNHSNQMLTNNNNVITPPTRTGYRFLGYYSGTTSGTQYIDANGKITQSGINAGIAIANSTTNWYAHWEAITYEDGLSYACGNSPAVLETPITISGNPPASQDVTYGQSYTLAQTPDNCAPASSGLYFSGWRCVPSPESGAGNITWNATKSNGVWRVSHTGTWASTTAVTCTAQWNALDYNVTYLPGDTNNDGTGSVPMGSMSSLANKHVGDTITTPLNGFAVPTGYVFDVWDCGNGLTGIDTEESFTMPADNVDCTAQWAAKNYSISYGSGAHGSVPNGGADPVVFTNGLIYGQTWTTKTFAETGIVADTGYVFSKWNTSADGSGTDYSAGTSQSAWTTDAGLTLYAIYTCDTANGYMASVDNPGTCVIARTVTYSAGTNGTGNDYSVTVGAGDEHELLYLSNTGITANANYAFSEWSCDNNLGSFDPGDNLTMPNANVTCTAQWVATVGYSVTYANGNCSGNVAGLIDQVPGATITLPSSTGLTVPDGYSFNDWNCDNSIGDKSVGSTFSMPSANVICTAKCTANTINLTWYQENGSAEIQPQSSVTECSYGSAIPTPLPTAPEKLGYKFKRWKVMP